MRRATAKTAALFILLTLTCAAGTACGGIEAARDAGQRAAGDNEGNAKEAAGPEPGSGGTAAGVPEDTLAAEGTNPVGGETTGAMGEGTTVRTGRVLDEKWYVDSDGNSAPDFIESGLGYDPERDDCVLQSGCPGVAGGLAGTDALDEHNTLLVLDSSGSMAEGVGGGQTKMGAAKEALVRYATATPDFVNLGFEVYGHTGSNREADRAESCRGAEVLEPLGGVDYQSFPDTLDAFGPTGWTPVEGALRRAGEAFEGEEAAVNRVILVSDGIETCGGDPVAAAEELSASGIELTVDVVGFGVPEDQEEQLRRVAQASGGSYASVDTAAGLDDYFEERAELAFDYFNQIRCIVGNREDAVACTNEAKREIMFEMLDRRNDAWLRGEKEEGDAIDDLAARVTEHYNEAGKEIYRASSGRYEEAQEDMEEARRRMRERYGEEISSSATCPEPSVVLAGAEPFGPRPGEVG